MQVFLVTLLFAVGCSLVMTTRLNAESEYGFNAGKLGNMNIRKFALFDPNEASSEQLGFLGKGKLGPLSGAALLEYESPISNKIKNMFKRTSSPPPAATTSSPESASAPEASPSSESSAKDVVKNADLLRNSLKNLNLDTLQPKDVDEFAGALQDLMNAMYEISTKLSVPSV